MIEIRTFLNTDIHKLANLWRDCAHGQHVFDSMTVPIFEDSVFSKPYFDHAGLHVACLEKSIVGMSLVGFAPDQTGNDLDRKSAILSRLMIASDCEFEPIASELLSRSKDYALRNGGNTLYYGSRFPHAPYLNGAYGGALVPGVMEHETELRDFLIGNAFIQTDQIETYQMSLSDFRPLVNRKQITAKRQCKIVLEADPMPSNWFDACNFGIQNCVDFLLKDRKTNSDCGNLRFWEIQPLSGMWGRRAAGLYFLKIAEDLRGGGLATMLLGDAFRQLHELGFSVVEVHLPRTEVGLCSLFQKLGFGLVGRNLQMKLELD